MKVMFIKPKIGDRRGEPYMPVSRMEPLPVAILSSLTPPDVERVFYDDRIEEIPFDEQADMAAISVDTFSAKRAYQVAARLRQRGIPVVLGGIHPSLLPEEASEHCDAVAVGAAEGTWPSIIEDLRGGRLKGIYRADQRGDGSGQAGGARPAAPDRSIFEGKKYLPVSLVRFGTGCPNNCTFCSVRVLYGGKVTYRDVDEVADEIRTTPHRLAFIIDDNLYADRDRTAELLTRMIPLKKRWFCQISADFAGDREFCRLMVESGCVGVTIGFESLSRENLASVNKRHAIDLDYEKTLRTIRNLGIVVYGTFILGLDGDTPGSFDRTLDFAVRSRLFLANFNHLMPYPGTPLYDRLKRERRLLFDRWWLDPGYRFGHATFSPLGMTPDELTAGCYRSRMKFNRLASILRRGADFRANSRSIGNALFYLRANMVSRKDIRRKQDLILGTQPGGTA